ncbi:MAG TPA: c-type cytochrome biogenesis protein CcsB [Mycobacteriales bacterium]
MPVDLNLAHASDQLFFVAIVLYTLAMLGYAAEFAFGRPWAAATREDAEIEAVVARTAVPADASELEAALVGPRTATETVSRPATAPAGPVLGDGRVVEVAASRPARSWLRRPVDPDDGAGAGGGSGALFGRIAVALTMAGWAVHVGSVTTRGLAAHRVPWGNMYEFSSMIALVAVTAFLLLLLRQPVRYLGAFVMLPVVCYMAIAGTVLYTPAGPLVPALNSYWIKIHVVAVITASGLFALSAVLTGLYLVRSRYDSVVARGAEPGPVARLGRLVPSAAKLDTNTLRVITFAFPIWTFGVIAGAIWAESAWGRYWGWDPKETWSFITWVIYAVYLHARATAGFKGRRAAVISLIGFAALTFDFYGVNLWFSGLHSYQGPGV